MVAVIVQRGRRGRSLALAVALTALLGALVPPTIAGAADAYRDCSGIAVEPGAALHRCDLPGIEIIGQSLPGISFAKSNIAGIVAGCDPDLPRTDLTGARIYRAIATNGRFCDAILTDADLHGTRFDGASFEDATLWRANLSWASLDGASLHFATVRDANLSNASFAGGAAIGAILDGVDAHRIDLRGTTLGSASLVGTDLRYAQLDGTDFTGADLTGANLRRATGLAGAIWSDTTCPDGTNSDANGGTCVGH